MRISCFDCDEKLQSFYCFIDKSNLNHEVLCFTPTCKCVTLYITHHVVGVVKSCRLMKLKCI